MPLLRWRPGVPRTFLVLLALATACAGAPRVEQPPLAGPVSGSVATAATAVRAADDKPVALDPRVLTGKLPNGLTYYVLPHGKPEKRAYLRLVVDAGSLVEDDDQQGLAHFVEHLAFTGTRRFPKRELIDLIEKSGMSFGAHLNASTWPEQTVYMLKVPTDDPALLDKSVQVLRDWAGDINLDIAAIDRERTVIEEERRSGRGADRRLYEKILPVRLAGSRYPERLVIGKSEVILKAPAEAFVRYYKDWYRPDLMAVVAVGDFDAAAMVEKIKSEFGTLANPPSPRPRPRFPVAAPPGTAFAVEADAEMSTTSVQIASKRPRLLFTHESDVRRGFAENLFHYMLNHRLDEIRRKPDAPFLGASSGDGAWARTLEAFSLSASAKEGQAERATSALMDELLRVQRHGFVPSELERARRLFTRSIQQGVKERETIDGANFVGPIIDYHLEQVAYPGIEGGAALAERFLPTYTAGELSQLAREWLSGNSRVVVVTGPDRKKLPEPAALTALLAAAEQRALIAYDDGKFDGPLVAQPPAPGKVVKSKTIAEVGVTEWRLANGIRVVVKPTTFKKDQILLRGISWGGSSLVKDADFASAQQAASVTWQGGIGSFDAVTLRKALTGKLASVSTEVNELEEEINASAAPEDVQTMFELVYLAFTGARADEPAFRAWRERQVEWSRNRRMSPGVTFNEDFWQYIDRNHLRRRPATPEYFQSVDPARALAIYKDRFGDAGDFTFIIVGNVDPLKLQPLVETYLGGLPTKGRKEKWRDVGVRPIDGPGEKIVVKGQEPKSQVLMLFLGSARFSEEARDDVRMLAHALDIRLLEVLRDELRLVYGVGASGFVTRRPRERYDFRINFTCAPDNVDKLRQRVLAELRTIAREGVKPDIVEKIKQSRRRAHETDLKLNGHWLGELTDRYRNSEPPQRILEIDRWVNRVSSDALRKAARRYLPADRMISGILMPEKTEGETKDPPTAIKVSR
jgi:zinc protease